MNSHVRSLNQTEEHSQCPLTLFLLSNCLPSVEFVVLNRTGQESETACLNGGEVCCFTDGSRLNGFVAYKDGSEWFSGSVSLGEWATVFQAEIHVISLVRGLYTRGLHESNINIFTDSQAALRAAQSGGEILDL